ncbi:MAG: hypothetical protein Q7T55_02215 [Solirubrobacteraceae bacterium]|nr:hypothetical protein [Solirubrobacteraceae bacterium]
MDQDNQPTEEELRAALEAELSQVHVGDVIAQTIVSLVNLGARRGGLMEVDEEEKDIGQLALSIEAIRRLLPLIEEPLGESAGQIKDALSQLQLAFAQQAPTGTQIAGDDPAAAPEPPAKPEPPNSGLWVPGQ